MDSFVVRLCKVASVESGLNAIAFGRNFKHKKSYTSKEMKCTQLATLFCSENVNSRFVIYDIPEALKVSSFPPVDTKYFVFDTFCFGGEITSRVKF